MRIKYIKSYKEHSKGDIAEVTPNEGFGLIDAGYAIVSKDITEREVKQKKVNYDGLA